MNNSTDPDCIFCSIANGPADKLIWQNEYAAAFKDLNPKAAVHVLVVPKLHIKNIDALDDEALAGKLVMAVREVSRHLGLVEANKILVQGIDMDHLHFHLMSDSRYQAKN